MDEIIKTMEEKLKELGRQYEDGMISAAEYAQKTCEAGSVAYCAVEHKQWRIYFDEPGRSVCGETVESHDNPETQESCSNTQQ